MVSFCSPVIFCGNSAVFVRSFVLSFSVNLSRLKSFVNLLMFFVCKYFAGART